MDTVNASPRGRRDCNHASVNDRGLPQVLQNLPLSDGEREIVTELAGMIQAVVSRRIADGLVLGERAEDALKFCAFALRAVSTAHYELRRYMADLYGESMMDDGYADDDEFVVTRYTAAETKAARDEADAALAARGQAA